MSWPAAATENEGETHGCEEIQLLTCHFAKVLVYRNDSMGQHSVVSDAQDEWEELWPLLHEQKV